jgi:hypothetical protein
VSEQTRGRGILLERNTGHQHAWSFREKPGAIVIGGKIKGQRFNMEPNIFNEAFLGAFFLFE